MNFRKWLEVSEAADQAFYQSPSDDPELNGLVRGLAHWKPVTKSKSKTSRRLDKLFGKIAIEATDHDRGAGVVFTDGKSILLLLRNSNCDNPSVWGLPAGGSKSGESSLQTAKRECKEEIGATFYNSFYKSIEEGWVFFFVKADKQFRCKLNREHVKWKWVEFGDLKKYKLHPKLKKKIDRYISKIKKEFCR